MKFPIDRGRPSERRMLAGRRLTRHKKQLPLVEIIRRAKLKNKPEEER